MRYIILFDPDGTHIMRLIEEQNINPSDVYVWDNIPTHIPLLRLLANKYKFNVIEKDLFTENIGMRFNKILSNPPYDDGMYVKTMKLIPNLLTDDGEFQFLVPNKILIPYTKGATFAKKNLRIDKIDLTYGPSFVDSIEGTWVCNVVGGLGETTNKFPLILPNGDVVETDFDSPNPVMEMNRIDFSLHNKVMRNDNKFVMHRKKRIDVKYFVYIRPTAKRVNNKLRYHGVTNEWVEGLENGFYQECNSKEQAETMLKIYTESELFQYISYCNIGFTMISRFNKEFLPNIEDCCYNSEQDVYDFFSVTEDEKEHIRGVLAKKRNKHH
jgi:hypothetical protein